MSNVLDVLEKVEKVPSGIGTEHRVLINPTKDELRGMESRSPENSSIRYIIDRNKDYYIWHSANGTHNDVSRHLGISPNKYGPEDENRKGNSSFEYLKRYNYDYRKVL